MTCTDDEPRRRAYWAEQMEAAYAFVAEMLVYPIEECGESLVSLRAVAEDTGVEVAFSDRPHVEGLPRRFLLREGLTGDFAAVARDMNERGWVLKVEDGFRTRHMQKLLARQPEIFRSILAKLVWELEGERPSPEFTARRVSALIAPCPKVGTHMSGSAIDISVLDRDSGREIDRGRPYLEMSEKTPMASPFVSDEAREARRAITALMRKHGFVDYPWEFWHYSKGDAYQAHFDKTGQPARYGAVDVDPASGRVTPIPDPTVLLNSDEELGLEVRRAVSASE